MSGEAPRVNQVNSGKTATEQKEGMSKKRPFFNSREAFLNKKKTERQFVYSTGHKVQKKLAKEQELKRKPVVPDPDSQRFFRPEPRLPNSGKPASDSEARLARMLLNRQEELRKPLGPQSRPGFDSARPALPENPLPRMRGRSTLGEADKTLLMQRLQQKFMLKNTEDPAALPETTLQTTQPREKPAISAFLNRLAERRENQ